MRIGKWIKKGEDRLTIAFGIKNSISNSFAKAVEKINYWIDPPTTIGAQWTDNGGGSYTRTNGTNDEIESTIALINGTTYKVKLTASAWTAGSIDVRLQGGTAVNVASADGVYIVTVTAGASGTTRFRSATFGTKVTIANIVIEDL